MKNSFITLIIVLLMISVTPLHAQTAEEMLACIPDTIIPFANAEQRAAFFDEKVKMFEFRKVDDNVYCLLRHIKTPEPDTSVELYDSKWHFIREVTFEDIPLESLIVKPDTMSQNEYERILKLSEFPIYDITFSEKSEKEDNKTLILKLQVPMLSNEEKERILPLFRERLLIWDGKTFK